MSIAYIVSASYNGPHPGFEWFELEAHAATSAKETCLSLAWNTPRRVREESLRWTHPS